MTTDVVTQISSAGSVFTSSVAGALPRCFLAVGWMDGGGARDGFYTHEHRTGHPQFKLNK